MKLSDSTREAYSEVNEIINLLDKEDREKVPLKLRKYFENERKKEYSKNIDLRVPINQQNLKRETIAIITMLNLKYICSNEGERVRLKKQYKENEQKYQKELSEKYNIDNLFKIDEEEKSEKSEELVVIKKESFFKKVANFIKKIFRKRS